jgi:hypothetical protein
MDTEEIVIHEINAPEYFKCYIEFEGHWRASRIAVPMIQADMALMVEPQPNGLFRIYFKKDITHIVEKILKGTY